MKCNPVAVANALAATIGIFYVACRLLVSLLPDLMFSVAQSWLHGIELTQLNSWNPSITVFFIGLISSTVFAWIIGYLFATTYSYFNRP